MPVPFDEAAYRRALAILCDRRSRVGIYAGLGCVNATHSLAYVAETLQAPVATSVSGKGVISDGHPLAVGWGYGAQGTRAAEKAFKEVDVVLAVGVQVQRGLDGQLLDPRGAQDRSTSTPTRPTWAGTSTACVGVPADPRLFLDRLVADATAIRRPANPRPGPERVARPPRARPGARIAKVRITQGVDPMLFLSSSAGASGPTS